MRGRFGCAALLALALLPCAAAAQSSDNVLLVINDASPASVQVGDAYAKKRGIPQDHIVHFKASTDETVRRVEFDATIMLPIAKWIADHSLQDKVLYIVLTKGVPLRIQGTDGRDGTVASVDSELTLLYRRMTGEAPGIGGRVPNPYYLADKPISDAKPFTRFLSDLYLVTRLDGFTVDDVLKLIDRGAAPVQQGQIVLDQRFGMLDVSGGDQWLAQARDRLKAAGEEARVVFDATRGPAATSAPVIGYYSFGSNDGALRVRDPGLSFVAGSIGGMFVSTDGRTFTEPPKDWLPGPSDRQGGLFGSNSQSLTADLVRAGLTGVSGHVAEPYLDATIRPQVLFPAYLAGFNLVESFYLAMPYLSWQTIIVGDPLCSPFSRPVLDPAAIAKAIDDETGLPALFAERSLKYASRTGLKVEALKLVIKADILERRDPDDPTVEPLLVQATAIEPRLTEANIRLGSRYDTHGDHAKAVERYRQVLAVDPLNILALNNLAYNVAVYENKPGDALLLAQKAYGLAQLPAVLDTLGWIHHLLGNDQVAVPFLERAVQAEPQNADILFHAAAVHEAMNDRPRARTELDAAIKADPKLADRPDVKALRARLR